jgi:hypothetical protein
MRMSAANGAVWRLLWLLVGGLTLSFATPAMSQYACTTNFCIKSQPTSVQTPPGWPAVDVEACCRTHWGALPGNIDWVNARPVMICTASGDYANVFPNCGDPNNLSQDFPLAYANPTIGIGVAWPNPKDYRYEMQSVPIMAGTDGTCEAFSSAPGKTANWWVYELKEPKRGSYVFTAAVSFARGEKGYYAILNACKLTPPAGG